MALQSVRFRNSVEIEGQLTIGLSNTTGTVRTVQAAGSEANINLLLNSKGTGVVKVPTGYATNVASDDDITNRAYILTIAKTYSAKQTFQANGTNAALNIGPFAGDPSSPSNGDIWYNLSTNKFRARQNGASVDLIGGGGGGTALLQREESGTSYTIQDSDNGYIIYFTSLTGCDITFANGVALNTEVTVVVADGAGPLNLEDDGTSVLFTVDNTFILDTPKTAATFVKKTTTDWYGFGAFISGGGGGGSGTVTSVGVNLPSIFSVVGSPITTSGIITATLVTQPANTLFAGPTTGADAAPVFRSIHINDIPDGFITFSKLLDSSAGLSVIGRSPDTTGDFAEIIATNNNQVLRRNGTSIGFGAINLQSTDAVTGTLPINNGGIGLNAFGTANTILGVNPAANGFEYKIAGQGIISGPTSIGLGGSFTGNATITTTGFGITFTGGNFTLTDGVRQLFLSSGVGLQINVGSDANYDILYRNTSGNLARIGIGGAGSFFRSGGSGAGPSWSTTILPNSATTGDIIYASNTNTYNNLTAVAVNNVLRSGGVGTAPLWGKVDLQLNGDITNVLTVTNGGTGTNNFPVNRVPFGNNAFALQSDAQFTWILANGLSTIGTNRGGLIGRTTNLSTGFLSSAMIQLRTSASPPLSDDLGPSLDFSLRTTANADTIVGQIGTLRTGADDTAKMIFTTASAGILTTHMNISSTGKIAIGFGNTIGTARLHIAAGTATAGTAPIKLNSGTPLSTTEDGVFEYHSSHLYFTIGSTRYQLDQQGGGGLSGSGTSGQIAYWTGASTIASEVGFEYNVSTNTFITEALQLGANTISGSSRTINIDGSASDISLNINSKGNGSISLTSNNTNYTNIILGNGQIIYTSNYPSGAISTITQGANGFTVAVSGSGSSRKIDLSAADGIRLTGLVQIMTTVQVDAAATVSHKIPVLCSDGVTRYWMLSS